MNWDDELPKPKAAITLGENLERLSISELEERVAALNAEIERVSQEIRAKKTLAAAAAALFNK